MDKQHYNEKEELAEKYLPDEQTNVTDTIYDLSKFYSNDNPEESYKDLSGLAFLIQS